MNEAERDAWRRLIAVVELLPDVLGSQLRSDAGLTYFEYFVVAMLSQASDRTLRMTTLAQRTNASVPRRRSRPRPRGTSRRCDASVLSPLSAQQIDELRTMAGAMLTRLDHRAG